MLDRVHPESVHALGQPELHRVFYVVAVADPGLVEIRQPAELGALHLRLVVPVTHAAVAVVPAQLIVVVGGQQLAVVVDLPLAGAAAHVGPVRGAGMVADYVQHHTHAPVVHGFYHPVHDRILRSENPDVPRGVGQMLVQPLEILGPIAVVSGDPAPFHVHQPVDLVEQRGQPHGRAAQFLQVIQFLHHAVQVAAPVFEPVGTRGVVGLGVAAAVVLRVPVPEPVHHREINDAVIEWAHRSPRF